VALLAFGIFAATFAALFSEAVRNWIWRPVLEVSYVHGPDYCDKPAFWAKINGHLIQSDCFYFRLRIANRGTRRAECVQVFVSDLHRQESGRIGPLVRRYSMNLKWTNIGKPQLDVLAQETERFCDIGHVVRPSERSQFELEDLPGFHTTQAILSLDVEVRPLHRTHLIEAGKYWLGVVVVASNARAIRKTLTIDLTGKWYEDLDTMLQQGIRIEVA
jgi:hypothetical protein